MSLQGRYPIGEQDFKYLRERNGVYVDKTRYIEKLVEAVDKYYFLARPRRFGKSLFLSTLRYFFEGKRQLFKDLYIDTIDWKWEEYPVLLLDLNRERYAEDEQLDSLLDNLFNEWEQKYGVSHKADSLSSRFYNIIKGTHEKTGKPVVILVDEYDKPLVGNLNKEDKFELYREKLASIYSNFKSSAEHIRLVFLTGVSRFSKLSIFSDLNNLNDITFEEQFADICGITEKELFETFSPGIKDLAEEYEVSYEKAYLELKERYDGYRFARNGSEIYNPWSLLNCLRKKDIENYWNMTGYPTIIAEALRNVNADLRKYLNVQCSLKELVGMDLRSLEPVALMYQTGYLTIKDYDKKTREYTLGIPNKEVKEGFFEAILPYYMKINEVVAGTILKNILRAIRQGAPEEFMRNLQAYFAGIGYQLKMENENNFQNAFYILMSLIGLNAHAEISTSDGRIDIMIETQKYIYIIELKYDGSAEEVLRQIEEKKYPRQWQTDTRSRFAVGVNFSSTTRCIEDWKIKYYNLRGS